MKNKRFIFAAICLVLVLGLSLTGFSVPSITLTYWTTTKTTDLEKAIAGFEKENPNIDVEVSFIPYATHLTDNVTALRANRGPDIIQAIQSDVPMLTRYGFLMPVEKFVKKDIKVDDYFPVAWEAFTVDEKIYGVPLWLGVEAVYYNKDLLKAGGFNQPPATWDEFLQWGEALKAQGKYVYGLTAGSPSGLSYRFLCWLFSAGGDVANSDWTKSTINQANAIKALKFETDLFKKGMAPPSGITDGSSEVYLMFISGNVATMIRGPQDMLGIYRDYRDFFENKLMIGPMPGVDADNPGYTTLYTWGLGINNKTKHPEAAWKFIEYMARPEVMAKTTFGDLPANREGLKYPGPEVMSGVSIPYSHPYYQAFAQQLDHTKHLPMHAKWPEIEKVIWDGYQKIIVGNANIEKMANDMAKQINKLLK